MVGEILRKRREELGIDLRDISRITKIRYDFLKAIEDGAFEKLPVEAYVRGYIREYAKILDIDPEPVIDAYIQQISPREDEIVLQKESSQRRGQKAQYLYIPLLSVLTLAAILSTIFLLIPEKYKTQGRFETKKENLLKVKNTPINQQQIPSPHHETKKEILSEGKDTLHTVKITAIDTTWLLVTIDGTTSKEILLHPGDSVTWDAQNTVSLKIGNAGGIRLIFDGKEIGPLGERGEVKKLNLPFSEL